MNNFTLANGGLEFQFGGFGDVFIGTVVLAVGCYWVHEAINVFNKPVGKEGLLEVVKNAANVTIFTNHKEKN